MIENKKQEIEEAFMKTIESARVFNEDLMALRSIELPDINELSNEERNEVIKIGRDLDMRVAFILRSILTQHGNVLFLWELTFIRIYLILFIYRTWKIIQRVF